MPPFMACASELCPTLDSEAPDILGQDRRRVQEDFKPQTQCPRNSPECASLGLAGIASLNLVDAVREILARLANSWVPNLWSSGGREFVSPSSWIASFRNGQYRVSHGIIRNYRPVRHRIFFRKMRS